jgi:hypothetical protein
MMITKHYRINIDIQTAFRLLDGACVRADKLPGVLYQHGLVQDNFVIIEWQDLPFFGLMKYRKFKIALESEDAGLFAFPEIIFVKERAEKSFLDSQSKTLQFEVPDYDDFKVRVRVRGAGQTRLIALTADLIED